MWGLNRRTVLSRTGLIPPDRKKVIIYDNFLVYDFYVYIIQSLADHSTTKDRPRIIFRE